jgi:hypothetical protein
MLKKCRAVIRQAGLPEEPARLRSAFPQKADPSLHPAPAYTAGKAKPRGTSLGMTVCAVFFRSL